MNGQPGFKELLLQSSRDLGQGGYFFCSINAISNVMTIARIINTMLKVS